MPLLQNIAAAVKSFTADALQGFFEITHNGFALVGLALTFGLITLSARPDLREGAEMQLTQWLQTRQIATLGIEVEADAIERTTAANPNNLPKQQAAVAYWLSRKYKVAPEPLSVLVAEAYVVGARVKLEPTLILAIMAVESGFNPFAQSPVGAQGLMQVMTRVHSDKYEGFGGKLAAFDPVTNLRVGVKVLQECIARAGSVEGGLRYYVGAALIEDDGGYVGKVLAEHARLLQVANGTTVALAPTSPQRAASVVMPAGNALIPNAPALTAPPAFVPHPAHEAPAPVVNSSEKLALLGKF
ncbi:MAG: transglycosylase SLT domain-containing protein [Burkholderiales bacterium]